MDRNLEALRDEGGEFAATLNVGERESGNESGFERRREGACSGYGILNGEVDADTANGRHGVGRVADAEQAGAVPAGESVDLDGEKFQLIPTGDLVDAIA